MRLPHFISRRSRNEVFSHRNGRQRPQAAPAKLVLKEVPPGRSWFYSIRIGDSCTLVEHRVPAAVVGAEAEPARKDYTYHHQGLSHAEATRLKRSLCGQGLFYAGGPL